MEASSLLNAGTTLMLFGMGFVFVFLTLLVIMTSLMSRLIILYEKRAGVLPEDGISSPTAVIPSQAPVTSVADNDKKLIAVFTAALRKYRSRNK